MECYFLKYFIVKEFIGLFPELRNCLVWYLGTLEIQFNEIDIEVVSNIENMKTSQDQEISRSMFFLRRCSNDPPTLCFTLQHEKISKPNTHILGAFPFGHESFIST